MEDIPPDMPIGVYGAYEPNGMCIWLNEDEQAAISQKNTGVISHEFTHYVHSISTWHGVAEFMAILGYVHAGIQRLEEQPKPIRLPLLRWGDEENCPPFIRSFVYGFRNMKSAITRSLGATLDTCPTGAPEPGNIYRRNGGYYIRVAPDRGVPIKRLALMEGAAVMKKCEAVGSIDDLEAKRSAKQWLYVAAYEACRAAAASMDPMEATKYVCDISLCARDMGDVFVKGIELVRKSGTVDMLCEKLLALYDSECRDGMGIRQKQLEQMLSVAPEDHKKDDRKSWMVGALESAVSAVGRRQLSPLSLISPVYLGKSLHELASEVGSPVIITNDMRLTSLAEVPLGTQQGRNATRVASRLCKWVIEEGSGPFACPYAGCPGCPPQRAGLSCKTDARLIMALPDDTPWCCLYSSAKELRIVEVVTSTL